MLIKSVSTKKAVLTVFVLAAATAVLFFYFVRFSADRIKPANEAVHYSYFSQKDFYEQAYSAAKPATVTDKSAIRGIMTNHHLLAASFIAETFNAVATSAPVTVLLISPNHFDAGKADVITSAESWQTPYGILQPDSVTVQKLSNDHLAAIEEDPFAQEHGVSGIVAFIKKSLPNATVVPVIFRNRITLAQSLKLADGYAQVLPTSTLIVGSFDFSHYLTSRAADFHDIENLADVESFNFGSLYNLDIDSRPGLAFFLRLLKDSGDQNFHLLERSNSAKLTRVDALETTSYIDGYFSAGGSSSATTDTLLSVPSIISSAEALAQMDFRGKQYALTYLERLFYGQDITDAFLEKPDSQALSQLARLKIKPVFDNQITENLGSLKVALIDCAAKGENGEERAKRAIDEGAETAVCQGTVENRIEIYKNKPIIYAAGDLLDGHTISDSKTSLAVGLAYQNRQLRICLLPIGAEQGQLKLLIGKENDKVLADTAEKSAVSEQIKQEIRQGIIIIQN